MKYETTLSSKIGTEKMAKIKIKIKSTIFETATRAYLKSNKVRIIKI